VSANRLAPLVWRRCGAGRENWGQRRGIVIGSPAANPFVVTEILASRGRCARRCLRLPRSVSEAVGVRPCAALVVWHRRDFVCDRGGRPGQHGADRGGLPPPVVALAECPCCRLLVADAADRWPSRPLSGPARQQSSASRLSASTACIKRALTCWPKPADRPEQVGRRSVSMRSGGDIDGCSSVTGHRRARARTGCQPGKPAEL